ncbi:uncharacterized protein LOC132742260 [Ruditapes philippinarum]|uniref:uncharacterized protein LOC132742260 n=1 Tax=Ruditapes philippinarum TaxID=129788 RepID=UPI00295BE24F|nr:uncharacterized protein LOC132742260 [Ruditapes philippinarum]
MELCKRSRRSTGFTLRCNRNRNHECASRKYSFFEKSKLTIQDIMVFIQTYLEANTLYQCSRQSGIHYQSAGVDWGSFIRELFKEHFHTHVLNRKLKEVIEIDESLFGRRIKQHRGNHRKGCKIWVFRMVERESNSIILYPVRDRSQKTLLPLIERHVEKGSTIYSDGWSAYCPLNELGYNHFSVIHKFTFKSSYRNLDTGEVIQVHTNRIEGAWKHAKDNFKSIAGTQLSQFEGHLAKVIWRSEVKGRYFEPFFDLFRDIYSLKEPPKYTYPTPLFDSWDFNNECDDATFREWEVIPTLADNDTDTDSGSNLSEGDVISISSDSARSAAAAYVTSEKQGSCTSIQSTSREVDVEKETESSDSEVNKTTTEHRDVVTLREKVDRLRLKLKNTEKYKKKHTMKDDSVCHSVGYVTLRKQTSRHKKILWKIHM